MPRKNVRSSSSSSSESASIPTPSDISVLRSATRRLTRRVSTFFRDFKSIGLKLNDRVRLSESHDLRISSIKDYYEMEVSLMSLPACRIKKEADVNNLLTPYATKLRERKDLDFLREDHEFDLIRIPCIIDISQICIEALLDINNQLSYTRYYVHDDEPPLACVPPYSSLTGEEGPGIVFSKEELEALFWEINRALGVLEGDVDLFAIRVTHEGKATLEKVCIQVDTATLWLFPTTVLAKSGGGKHMVMPSTSQKPIKCVVNPFMRVKPGLNCQNLRNFVDRLKLLTDFAPNPDCWLVIDQKPAEMNFSTNMSATNYTIALMFPSALIRNEMLFVLNTWILIASKTGPELSKLLGLQKQQQDMEDITTILHQKITDWTAPADSPDKISSAAIIPGPQQSSSSSYSEESSSSTATMTTTELIQDQIMREQLNKQAARDKRLRDSRTSRATSSSSSLSDASSRKVDFDLSPSSASPPSPDKPTKKGGLKKTITEATTAVAKAEAKKEVKESKPDAKKESKPEVNKEVKPEVKKEVKPEVKKEAKKDAESKDKKKEAEQRGKKEGKKVIISAPKEVEQEKQRDTKTVDPAKPVPDQKHHKEKKHEKLPSEESSAEDKRKHKRKKPKHQKSSSEDEAVPKKKHKHHKGHDDAEDEPSKKKHG